jgi:hypothetical protein
MDLGPFHLWFVFIHVVGVFVFLLGHGISAGVMWRLRSERDPAALRALLGFSTWSMGLLTLGGLIWLIAGVVAGFSGNYWTSGTYWIWASVIIAVITIVAMTPMGRFYLNRVRAAVGVDPKSGAVDPDFAVDAAALEKAIASGNPLLLAVLGVGTVIVLSYLMFFKPF